MTRQIPVFLAALLPLGQAGASNLLQDAGFADGIDPSWVVSVVPAGVSWSSTDKAGASDSGSLLFTDVGEFGAQVSQCVNVGMAAVSRAEFS